MRVKLSAMEAAAGLCASCAHHRVIENARGSRFHLCEQAKLDLRFAKYPRLPVLSCQAYEGVGGSTNGGS